MHQKALDLGRSAGAGKPRADVEWGKGIAGKGGMGKRWGAGWMNLAQDGEGSTAVAHAKSKNPSQA